MSDFSVPKYDRVPPDDRRDSSDLQKWDAAVTATCAGVKHPSQPDASRTGTAPPAAGAQKSGQTVPVPPFPSAGANDVEERARAYLASSPPEDPGEWPKWDFAGNPFVAPKLEDYPLNPVEQKLAERNGGKSPGQTSNEAFLEYVRGRPLTEKEKVKVEIERRQFDEKMLGFALGLSGPIGLKAKVATGTKAGIGAVEGIRPAAGNFSPAHFTFDAATGQYRDLRTGQFVAPKNLPWPKPQGFVSSTRQTLQPGKILDRFGKENGSFFGDAEASISQRGLPKGYEEMPYRQYRLLKPLDVRTGAAAPVPEFGAQGGAMQYVPIEELSVNDLIREGYLEELK